MKCNNYRSIYKKFLYCSAALLAFAPVMQVDAEDAATNSDYELVNVNETNLHSLNVYITEDENLNMDSSLYDLVQTISSLHKDDVNTDIIAIVELTEKFIYEQYAVSINLKDSLINTSLTEETIINLDEEQIQIMNNITLEDMITLMENNVSDVSLEEDSETIEPIEQGDESLTDGSSVNKTVISDNDIIEKTEDSTFSVQTVTGTSGSSELEQETSVNPVAVEEENTVSQNSDEATDLEETQELVIDSESQLIQEEESLKSSLSSNQVTTSSTDEVKRNEMYLASVNAGSASEAWLKAIDGYTAYPDDDRFKVALELAGARNISYAEYLESREKYESAQWYFNRVLRGPWISAATESYVTDALTRVNGQIEEMKREAIYLAIVNEADISEAWNKALEGYSAYPEDDRFKDAIEQTAARMISYAEDLKKEEKAESAEMLLNRILMGPWISEATRLNVTEVMKRVNGPMDEAKREVLYLASVNGTDASEAWLKAIYGYKEYPNDDRFKDALELAAARNISYAEMLESRGKLENALWYFNRVINAPWISEATLTYVTEKADSIKTIIDKDFIYNKAVNATSLSERWSLSVEGHTNHITDDRLENLVRETSISILDKAFNEHKTENYSGALQSYKLLFDAPSIVSAQEKMARQYAILAGNNVSIDKASYNLSLYNQTMDEALDEQMKYSPKSDGAGKILATRQEVEYYLNPNNFVQLNNVNNDAEILNGTVDTSVLNVRTGPGTDNIVITTIQYGTMLKVLDYDNGWYKVAFEQNDTLKEGWVSSAFVKVEKRESQDRDLFEAYYPVLTVTANSLNVRKGPGTGYSILTSVSKNNTYRVLDEQLGWFQIKLSNNQSGWVSGGYVTVSKNINRSTLQFLKLSGSSGISAEDLNEELVGKGILDNTGEAFRLASQHHNINEVYLMAHAQHESGNGTSSLATGVLVSEVDGVKVEPRTVYNMYGIYAFDDSALKSGSEYAYKKGWFTPEEAIIGGAEWISSRYINHSTHKQDTLYKMRWNPAKPGVHQYATHVAWSQIQTSTLNTLVELSQKYNLNLHFDIPKYN